MRVDIKTAWCAALKCAGIENFRIHDWRHTWASWLAQTGISLSALQEMGVGKLETVRQFAHLAPNYLTEHACKIDAILKVRTLIRHPELIRPD
ncbi:tyrosine-type recombinase/integrase [Erwinia amylovora]|nr:tyrosine-type recombinase/integrase [Erwinia amylovora]MBZ2402863.1 tyrosine-type recombinase/integrase [Erwinia amylovora]